MSSMAPHNRRHCVLYSQILEACDLQPRVLCSTGGVMVLIEQRLVQNDQRLPLLLARLGRILRLLTDYVLTDESI